VSFRNTKALDPRKLFELSGWILQEVPGESERRHLSHRLNVYLNGNRRGRLRLPQTVFSNTVQTLTDLTKSQIRKVAFWIKPEMSLSHAVNRRTAEFIHRVAPGMTWTSTGQRPVYSQSTVGSRLSRRLKPRSSCTAWPSAPDIFEILEMSRRGIRMPVLDNAPLRVDKPLKRRDVSDNIRLASIIVARQIVGLRETVELPRKFLGHFRTYNGFSILVNRYKIPSGLTRFLLAQWIRSPASLWLVQACPFRIFLNRHKFSDFIRERSTPVTSLRGESVVEGVGSAKDVSEPEDLWSIYVPRLHLFQEISVLQEIAYQRCFPSSSNRQ